MKILLYILSAVAIISMSGCHAQEEGDAHEHAHEAENQATDDHHDEAEVHLSDKQMDLLGLKVRVLQHRPLTGIVEANGRLEVPPQNEASVTAVLGGNISDIHVIEGDKVKKGQLLAYLQHPDIINMQTEYMKKWNQLSYLEEEYSRQKRLYDAKVGSGKDYQKTKSEYQVVNSEVRGLEVQLSQLGILAKKLQSGQIYQRAPLVSPIDGFVETVEVKIGQYVTPNTELFSLVNTHHIHVDIMVFEKDIQKVEEGQTIIFTIETLPEMELEAKIYSVSKSFEQNPKAVHVHAEIQNKMGKLIPGMYINAKIIVNEEKVLAIPESGIFSEDNEDYIFTAAKKNGEWSFKPVKVKTGLSYDGWVEVDPIKPIRQSAQVAQNSAYYLMSEMKKGEAKHSH